MPDALHATMFRIGRATAYLLVGIMVLAIVAWIVWPYAPETANTAEILAMTQEDPVAAAAALDISFLVGVVFNLPLYLALYVALRPVDGSWSLVALAIGFAAVAASFSTRPVLEIFIVGEQYASAADEVARMTAVAAGDALLTHLDGTAWAVTNLLAAASVLIFSAVMLRAEGFARSTAWLGIVTNVAALGFLVPGGAALMLLVATIAAVLWALLLARDFGRLAVASAHPTR